MHSTLAQNSNLKNLLVIFAGLGTRQTFHFATTQPTPRPTLNPKFPYNCQPTSLTILIAIFCTVFLGSNSIFLIFLPCLLSQWLRRHRAHTESTTTRTPCPQSQRLRRHRAHRVNDNTYTQFSQISSYCKIKKNTAKVFLPIHTVCAPWVFEAKNRGKHIVTLSL